MKTLLLLLLVLMPACQLLGIATSDELRAGSDSIRLAFEDWREEVGDAVADLSDKDEAMGRAVGAFADGLEEIADAQDEAAAAAAAAAKAGVTTTEGALGLAGTAWALWVARNKTREKVLPKPA